MSKAHKEESFTTREGVEISTWKTAVRNLSILLLTCTGGMRQLHVLSRMHNLCILIVFLIHFVFCLFSSLKGQLSWNTLIKKLFALYRRVYPTYKTVKCTTDKDLNKELILKQNKKHQPILRPNYKWQKVLPLMAITAFGISASCRAM